MYSVPLALPYAQQPYYGTLKQHHNSHKDIQKEQSAEVIRHLLVLLLLNIHKHQELSAHFISFLRIITYPFMTKDTQHPHTNRTPKRERINLRKITKHSSAADCFYPPPPHCVVLPTLLEGLGESPAFLGPADGPFYIHYRSYKS